MALSYCSSQAPFQHLNPEMTTFQHTDTSTDICFCDNCATPITSIDPYLNPDDFIYAENNPPFLPLIFATDPLLYFTPEIPPGDEFEFCRCPKRIRNHNDVCTPFAATYSLPEFSSELMFSPAELPIPTNGFSGGADGLKRPNGPSSSAQSVAARQRRKKISEKTHELGKLIPGGNRMNTAEMFQAAFKYVKFLQAQVGILELMGSTQEYKVAPNMEELHVLVSSVRVQEKLYEEEKCMVPRELVEALAKDQGLQSRPCIGKDLDFFVQSMT